MTTNMIAVFATSCLIIAVTLCMFVDWRLGLALILFAIYSALDLGLRLLDVYERLKAHINSVINS